MNGHDLVHGFATGCVVKKGTTGSAWREGEGAVFKSGLHLSSFTKKDGSCQTKVSKRSDCLFE